MVRGPRERCCQVAGKIQAYVNPIQRSRTVIVVHYHHQRYAASLCKMKSITGWGRFGGRRAESSVEEIVYLTSARSDLSIVTMLVECLAKVPTIMGDVH